MKQVKNNLDTCPYCKSEISSENTSFHVINIKYKCGCEIVSAVDDHTYYLLNKCSKDV